MDEGEELDFAIAEAIAAFDAGNHAFGRFVTYVVRPQNQPIPAEVQAVREALQEVAIAVPQETTTEAATEFLTALRAARESVARFLADPPGGYALEEARESIDTIDEAVQALEGALDSLP
jgi:hypothetical protein